MQGLSKGPRKGDTVQNKKNFRELSSVKIQPKRNVVISENSRGQISIAQQVVFEEGNFKMGIFLKGSILVDPELIVDFRDAINEAICMLDSEKEKEL